MAIPKPRKSHGPVKSVKHISVKKHAPCPFSHEPNEETKQAMRDVDAGVGLTRCKDIDDFWKKLHE